VDVAVTTTQGTSTPSANDRFSYLAPPAFASASSASFVAGQFGSFTVQSSGFPVPTYSVSGTLPGGVTLGSASGILSGTPAAPGIYDFTIIASNGVSSAQQSFELRVEDVTPPNAAIDSGPPSLTNSGSAVFAFHGNDPLGGGVASGVNHLEVSLDGGAFVTATSPSTFSGLLAGSHTFAARAVDNAGNIGAASTYSWTVVSTTTGFVSAAWATGFQANDPITDPVRTHGQTTYFGLTSFATLSGASASIDSSGTIYVDPGTYNDSPTLAGMQSLHFVAPGTVGLGNLKLGTGTLALDLGNSMSYDQLAVSKIDLTGATLSLNVGTASVGDNFMIVSVAGADPSAIAGTFNGLPTSGSAMTVGGRQFSINYTGGDGNDITLTALPAGASPLAAAPLLNGGSSSVNNVNFSHQHSMVESIAYTFSSAVNLTAANFTLTGINGTTFAPAVTPTGSSGNTVWTVTFSGDGVNSTTRSIGDGEYRLALNVGSISNTYDFFRLLGDLDGNGKTDFSDFQSFNTSFNRLTSDPLYLGAADFDGSGTVEFSDFQIFNTNFNHALPAPLPPNCIVRKSLIP
jgi:hypothetical protein